MKKDLTNLNNVFSTLDKSEGICAVLSTRVMKAQWLPQMRVVSPLVISFIHVYIPSDEAKRHRES